METVKVEITFCRCWVVENEWMPLPKSVTWLAVLVP